MKSLENPGKYHIRGKLMVNHCRNRSVLVQSVQSGHSLDAYAVAIAISPIPELAYRQKRLVVAAASTQAYSVMFPRLEAFLRKGAVPESLCTCFNAEKTAVEVQVIG